MIDQDKLQQWLTDNDGQQISKRLTDAIRSGVLHAEADDFNRDAAALDWARGKVRVMVNRCLEFEGVSRDRGNEVERSRWRGLANLLSNELVGNPRSPFIAAFDERLPMIEGQLSPPRTTRHKLVHR